MSEPALSRADIIDGRFAVDRRASRTLATIEARVSHMKSETRRAVNTLFSGGDEDFSRTFGDDYLRSLKLKAVLAEVPEAADIERFAPQWRPLLPPEPDVRASLIEVISTRYGGGPDAYPAMFDAVGFGDPAVAEAFRRVTGKDLADYAFPAPRIPNEAPGPVSDIDPRREAEAELEWVSVRAGTRVISAGERPDYLYYVISGRFRVLTGHGADRRTVATIGRGELIGEIGVLTGEPRMADIVALRDSEIVRLPQEAVLRLAHRSPRMLLMINHVLAERLRREVSQVEKPASTNMTIVLVAMHSDAPLPALVRGLLDALKKLGSVAHVTRDAAERRIPRLRTAEDPSQDAELLAWLSEQEAGNDIVLFEADTALSPWTNLCIRQADRVVLVTEAGRAPTPGEVEKRVAEITPDTRRELVLIHPAGTRQPSGTRHWLRPGRFAAHHHVILGDAEKEGRAARRLAGAPFGLVLGGGGARGYAHLGAWRAFEELGVPVDIVGGTSSGALMGAVMATDHSASEMRQLGEVFATAHVKDFTLPLVSFFSTRALTMQIRALTADVQIEDLWRPFFCVSTSLKHARPVIHTRGPLWKAIRATTAIPGVFAPMSGPDGDVLVDGGIMNNVPVDVMRDMCERGPVFAVNLAPAEEQLDEFEFGPWVSGWRILWSRLNPFATKTRAPSIMTTLMRTTEVGSTHRMRTTEVLSLADVLVNPQMQGYGLLDFKHRDVLASIGYDSTREAVAAWLKDHEAVAARLPQGAI